MMVTGDEKGKAVYKRVYSWILSLIRIIKKNKHGSLFGTL